MTGHGTAGQRARTGRGIALLAGLVMLAALSLLALVAANSAVSQQRMAANYDDAHAARESAELALSAGLTVLRETPGERRLAGCASDCFVPPTHSLIRRREDLPALPEFESAAWWQAEGLLPGIDAITGEPAAGEDSEAAEAPRFTIEEIDWRAAAGIAAPPEVPAIDGIGYYRILGRGAGRGQAAVAVHEAIVARPWPGVPAAENPPADWVEFCAPFRPLIDCGRMAWRARR